MPALSLRVDTEDHVSKVLPYLQLTLLEQAKVKVSRTERAVLSNTLSVYRQAIN
jgi:hypothetical protein